MTRLLSEHGRGAQPVKGLEEGFPEGSEVRHGAAEACRTGSCHSPASWKPSAPPRALKMESNSFIRCRTLRDEILLNSLAPLDPFLALLGRLEPTTRAWEMFLLYSTTCPRARHVTLGPLHRLCLSCPPPLLQGRQLACRLRSPVPSMRLDNNVVQ